MERLTFDGNFCDIAMCGEVRGGSFCEDGFCSQRKTWERLKAIEDILGDNYDLARLREIVQADRDGRCVVLPCKVGEAVYQVDDGDIFDMTVESIQIDSDDPTDMAIFTDELTLDPRDFQDNVFRTEREARAALKGKQNEV